MIPSQISDQIKTAMKARDEIRLSTLKMLLAALTNAEIAKRPEKMTEADKLKAIQSEAKKRKDAIEAYEQAGQKERAEKEKAELKIIQEFLPEEMRDEAIAKIVDQVIAELKPQGMQDLGRVMGAAMKQVAGKADGNRVSAIVRQKLTT